ncbi:MAG: hypothetical protein J0I20_33890 [Chloroflexi bacterium]|nr:hypothetical protein [Chloroflexota bacterium]OJW05612.1 MAG: hypothetical protein BGO39_03065 [Chloroflexi bacterium 54-19]
MKIETKASLNTEDLTKVIKTYFEQAGYRVLSGLDDQQILNFQVEFIVEQAGSTPAPAEKKKY